MDISVARRLGKGASYLNKVMVSNFCSSNSKTLLLLTTKSIVFKFIEVKTTKTSLWYTVSFALILK